MFLRIPHFQKPHETTKYVTGHQWSPYSPALCLEVVRPRQAAGDRRVELRIFGDLVRDEARGLSGSRNMGMKKAWGITNTDYILIILDYTEY